VSLKSSVNKISRELDAIYEEQFELEANKIPDEDLDFFISRGYWPDGKRYKEYSLLLRCRPIPPGFEGRTEQELEFFVTNGRWPEQERTER
jgi:hypothetical protein